MTNLGRNLIFQIVRLFLILLCVCVCTSACVCACLYTHVCGCMYMCVSCVGQRLISSAFSNTLQLSFWIRFSHRIWSPLSNLALLAQDCSWLCFPSSKNTASHGCAWLSTWVVGTRTQISMLIQPAPHWLSHLPSPKNLALKLGI